jgi:photosystem II stability/assembly factor-like uncharacterized protein
VLGLLSLLILSLSWAAAPSRSAAAPSSPQFGPWEHQAPYPTRFAVDGVDMVSPTEAWAVASTDILHTTDGGATWEKQPRPGYQNLYSIDFFDNQHGIAFGNTVLYTTNGGATWNQGSTAFGYDVEMATATLAFATDHRVAGYFRSTDGGATWVLRNMPSNITTIQCFDALNCVANSPTGTYHSTDGGLQWTFVAGTGGNFASTYFINHNQGWLVYGDQASRTTDGGATWQIQTLPPGSWIYDVVFTSADNGWGVGDNVVRTTNGGATWQDVPVPAEAVPLWDVDFVNDRYGIAGGDSFLNTESIILTSADGGATWATRTQGSINEVQDMVALDRDHAWASHSYGGKTSRTTNGGRTWQLTEVGDQYVLLSGIDLADSLRGWTVGFHNTYYDGHIYHTADGGASWQRQWDPGSDVLRSVAALDPQTAIIVGGANWTGSLERRTTDGGLSWHSLNMPIASFFFDVFFLDDQTGWMVGGNGDIVKSTDGGDTWVVQPNPAQYTLTTIHFSDPNNGWAGGSYGTLVRTTDGGATWTAQDPQIPDYTHVLDVNSTSPLRGWIAGYGGGASSRPYVKYTTDGGATWIEHTPQVGPYDSFGALAFLDDESGWAAGAGGIFRHGSGGPQPTATSIVVPPTSTTVPPTALATNTPPGPPSPTPPPVATATPCTIRFTDVDQNNPFYGFIRCLACRQVVSGYADGTFRWGNDVTRGQLAKIIAGAADLQNAIPSTQQTFSDVPHANTFWLFIERLSSVGAIAGYACGGAGEPCDPQQRPYFRWEARATRGQISKITAVTAGWNGPIPTTRQTFTDVPPANAFWLWIEELASRQIIAGYNCGGAGEPCDPQNRPYFRWGNNATRGQMSKIAAESFFPGCQTPAR